MIRYRIDASDRHAHSYAVEMTIDAPAAELRLSLPVWIPGSYLVREFARHLHALVAEQGGHAIPLQQLDELANYYKLADWLTVDADIAFARARFRGVDPSASRIPGAVEGVASLAVAVDNLGPWFGAAQLRYFGPRPLIEDNSTRSNSTSTLNARIGYRVSPKTRIEVDGYNLTNRKAAAIVKRRRPGWAVFCRSSLRR